MKLFVSKDTLFLSEGNLGTGELWIDVDVTDAEDIGDEGTEEESGAD